MNADGTVDAKVTFPKDAGYSVGDTVVIKDQDGTELVKRPLTAEDLEKRHYCQSHACSGR
ncbi:hypothetical protein [Acinetobacter baumannii]|uniref:hypothetical protein n=1 Tax=Acinetobacter baumannii TaxID=470 RepID=UPI0036F456F6